MLGFGLLALRVGAVALLFLFAGASGALAQQRVGVSSAVNPEAASRPPGGTVRKLVIGQEIVFNERITTEAAGQTQLLFLDESSMSIGPNSDLTIDQFVYDPKSGTGKLTMSATRGLLRYVGGKLSKQDDAVTLRTSTATLAVRGGAFIANITDIETDAIFIYGRELRITGAAGGFQTVTRSGFHSVTAAGGSPSPPGPTPPGQLAGFTQRLDGRTGGTGGASDIPTDTSVANSGVSATISGNFNASLQQSTQNQGATQPNFQPAGSNRVPNTITSQLGTVASPQAEILFVGGGATTNPTTFSPPTQDVPADSTALQQTGSTRIFAFSVQPDATLQSNIPFIRGQAGGNLPNATVSPLYVVAPSTTPTGDSTTPSAARALQASLAINGQGANQQSTIAVTTGTIDVLQSNGQPILTGHLRGSSLQSASGAPVRVGSTVSSTIDAAGNSLFGKNSGFVLDPTQFNSTAPGSGIITTPGNPSTASEIPLSGAATNYGFTQPALPTAVPAGVGTNRTTQTIAGSFGGLMYTTAQPSSPYILTGTALISTDAPNNRIQATLSGNAQSVSVTVKTLTMQYGSLTGNSGGREAFVDNNTFAVLESQVNPQQANGENLVINGDPGQAGKLYLLSSGAAPPPTSLLPAGASYCQCQYLQWGYWGGDLRFRDAADTSIPRVDRGHINTWVAGVPTPLNDLNTLMSQNVTGTYTGHAIGSVFNNGQSYVAAGGFTGSYNFGTQTGTMAVNNFDGRSFAASGSAPLTGANYSFGVTSPGVAGAVNGTFYGPMAAETGGNFAVKNTAGPAYLASGIFAGKR